MSDTIAVSLGEPVGFDVTLGATPVLAVVSPVGTIGKPGPPGPPGIDIVAVPYEEWPPADPQPDTLYLRLAP